jgi:adenylate cyclase
VAIVGTRGPPDAPIYSAIGDMVNTAARLENMTKAFDCVLVITEQALKEAGVAPAQLADASRKHQVRVRGKTERIAVYAVPDPRTLLA